MSGLQWRSRGWRVLAMQELPLILFLEDDQMIQDFVEEALSEAGFAAAIGVTGEEIIALLAGNKDKYRALVTDINLLGKLSGWEVAQRARELVPDFPIIYMSGAQAADW